MRTLALFQQLRDQAAADGIDTSAFGIDLGTTKSCLARANADNDGIACRCLSLDEPGVPAGAIAMPSVVAAQGDERWFGHAARRRWRMPRFQPGRGVFAETKNDMGLRLPYHRAPEGFRAPTDIAALLLAELARRAEVAISDDVPVVVTVPASFHGAQRQATLQAARRAFGESAALRLLDEPYAAMLDLLHRNPQALGESMRPGGTCLVFDFGGGTCDVAIFALDADARGTLQPHLRATSRYHRIGGGDIDRAIVHGHLLPHLLAAHGLGRTEVAFGDKRRKLEPQLLPIAEQLKLGLCRKLAKLGDEARGVEAVAAGDYRVELDGRELWLADPSLDQATFERLLGPFIDPDPGRPSSDEYVERESVFAPLVQALSKARLAPAEIDAVVLAGSSSLIPQVRAALGRYFNAAQMVELGNEADLQGAIARGAALQALSIAFTGAPLIAPVCSTEIALRTRQGLYRLAAAGDSLPYTSNAPVQLSAPEASSERALELAIEVMADSRRMVGRSVRQLEAPVLAGEPLELSMSIDENQCVGLRIERTAAGSDHDGVFEVAFDAPLTHIDQGQLARCRLLECEEAIRRDLIPQAQLGRSFEQMARDAGTLGHWERALHLIACAIQHDGPTLNLLNLRAIYLERLGDATRAEATYRQIAGSSLGDFNLALFLHHRQRDSEALPLIEQAIESSDEPAFHVLKADILSRLGNQQAARLHYQDAVASVGDPARHTPWSLGWLARGARSLGQRDLASKFSAEANAQREPDDIARLQGALLPDLGPGIAFCREAA